MSRSQERFRPGTFDPPPGLLTVPRQRRAQESLARVLSAAEALIKKGGLDALTMAGLAEAAGVSVGSIYRYFPDRRAVVIAVQDRFLSGLEAEFRGVSPADSLETTLGRLIDCAGRSFIENARMVGAFLSLRSDDVIAARGRASQVHMEETLLRACIPFSDAITHPDPVTALTFVHSTMTGLMILISELAAYGETDLLAKWTTTIAELKQSSLIYLQASRDGTPP